MDTALQPTEIIDELIYRGYAANRDMAPDISPERWAKIFANGPAMEKRYQAERATWRKP